jgi:hypothetical protein
LIRLELVRLIALKPSLFKEDTARRQRLGFLVTDALVVHAASLGAAERAHEPFLYVDDEVIFDRMRFFPAIASLLHCSASVGRRVCRSVPSMMTSTETQSASTGSRCCGCRWGKPMG